MSDLFARHLKGKRITGFVIREHSSCLVFEEGYSLSIDGLCRYLGKNGPCVITEDHGHKFGLPAAFDAESAIQKQILGQEVTNVSIRDDSKDMMIWFANGVMEIISTSTGYETAQLHGPKGLFVVLRHE
jgi:hypothetical protein